ncbi:F-type H+-transporting ATPase subunit gamma [Faecalicoccus acidiformans]|uniref:ATP synthase gamma chain n=1 Tax=Faecalicoccus acidiformans TaxID=915173 RepID=A0A7W8D0T5_9FIRM|nr:ATP synthase F1 subunit gamma [Faecalicoccus acidiformans]MBB5185106.1 F-type H+-transporting ATPase subunit gamma [Faecalicoccus acidiformans]MBM6830565.1 ATP synthase F1 subunit gamma [Faecalicoccus acidiformans]MDM8203021.1 ATP synthase F1 subunit gamma [Faecalicoccus acidiformans]
MAQTRQAIQARIKSVDSTKKITKAMQLVASSKLTKQKQIMEQNREYASALEEMLMMVLRSAKKNSIYLNSDKTKPSYVFVIASDMGLCGGYNANIFKKIQSDLKAEDQIVMIGSRGLAWIKNRNYTVVDQLCDLNEDSMYPALSSKMEEALHLYEKQDISSIKILYTHYKNTLTFVPTLQTILPVSKPLKEENKLEPEMIFEPGKQEMLADMIPMAMKSVLFSKFLESKTSEQASRRMAMESATDNANELQDALELAFNQARQAAITQEITEIVGGANALG